MDAQYEAINAEERAALQSIGKGMMTHAKDRVITFETDSGVVVTFTRPLREGEKEEADG